MIFIKLVRALGLGVAAGLFFHLLYSAGKKNAAARQQSKSGTHRKYVESSVIEKKDERSEPNKKDS